MRTASRFVLGALLALAAIPSALLGQEQEEAPAVPDEGLLLFVRVHLDIVEAREEFNQQIAVTHDDPGKEEHRRAMNQRLAEIYESHGMPEEEYQRITLEISLDQARREEFERLLDELGGA